MLINLTNHPVSRWSEEQRRKAIRQWNEIEDYPFPSVGAQWNDEQMKQCAEAIVTEITAKSPDAVLCQGEMSMTFLLVAMLQKKGIPVYAATSERQAREELLPDGTISKNIIFNFVQFRKYGDLAKL